MKSTNLGYRFYASHYFTKLNPYVGANAGLKMPMVKTTMQKRCG